MPSQASDYIGVYEQQPPRFESKNKELVKKALDKFNKNKFTLHIGPKNLSVSMWGEKDTAMPYEVHGKTIVAKNEDGMYWVLYIETTNSIHSTGMKFNRVSSAEP